MYVTQLGSAVFEPVSYSPNDFGMSYPIDVVYLDHEDRVIHRYEALKPNRPGRIATNGCAVIEFPAGAIKQGEIEVGDVLIYSEK